MIITEYPPIIVTTWRFLQRWGVPIMMSIAYIVLALTSETDATGWAWMSIGLAFVMVIWWTFRVVTEDAALSRAAGNHDAKRLLELSDLQIRRGRKKYYVWRAIALHQQGDRDGAIAALDRAADLKPPLALRAALLRIDIACDTGDFASARAQLDRLGPSLETRLAEGRVLTGEGKRDEARALYGKIIDDIRAGEGQRALAHEYAAQIAEADGNPALAAKHRAAAARGQKPPAIAKPT